MYFSINKKYHAIQIKIINCLSRLYAHIYICIYISTSCQAHEIPIEVAAVSRSEVDFPTKEPISGEIPLKSNSGTSGIVLRAPDLS